MFKQTLAAAIGAALTTLAVVSVASAAQSITTGYAFHCQSQMTGAKTHPVGFNCNAMTPEGVALLRPTNCDPAAMSWGTMQANCNAMNTMVGDGPGISGKHTGGAGSK